MSSLLTKFLWCYMLKVDTTDISEKIITNSIKWQSRSDNVINEDIVWANCIVGLLLTDEKSSTNLIIRCVRSCVWFSSCTYNNHVLGNTYDITKHAYIDFIIHRLVKWYMF